MNRAELRSEIKKLDTAARAKRGEESLNRLRYLTESRRLQEVPIAILSSALWAIRSTRESQLLQYAFDLMQSETFTSLDSEVQLTFASLAFLHSAKTHDASRVQHLLPYIEDPDAFGTYLSDRTYEWLWPDIEQYAGESLVAISQKHVLWAKQRFERAASSQNLYSLAEALYDSGEFNEAVTLVRRGGEALGGIEKMGEYGGRAISTEAKALDALGRRQEADALYEEMLRLNPRRNPWVMTSLLERSARLIDQGRWEESLTAVEEAENAGGGILSAVGKTVLAGMRTCALQKLGRTGGVEAELDVLRRNFEQSTLTVRFGLEGLLCAGLNDEAEARTYAFLTQEGGWVVFDSEFREANFALPSGWPSIGKFIQSRPALREKMLQYLRPIPDQYIPRSLVGRKDISLLEDISTPN